MQTNEIYAANRRSIFLVEDDELGRIAVKEMRHEGALRRLWFRTARYPTALREFRTGSDFEARGGRTPGFLGCAMERHPLGLKRVLLFIRWLDDAHTLTRYLERFGGRPEPAVWNGLARMLVDSARLGLVHGRHSSDNVLVVENGSTPEFYTIDFAYSKLYDRFRAPSFVRDVARIAHWLWHENVCDPPELARLFSAVAERAWSDPAERAARRGRMAAELERWQRVLDKSAF